MRMILMAAALALAACGQASAPATQTAQAQTPPAAPERVVDNALRVTCNAYYQADCGDLGCTPQGQETAPSIPVAITYDGDNGGGQLCMATGCEAVTFAPLPGRPQGPRQAMAAAVMSAPDAAASPPNPHYNGTVIIARDAGAFQFIQYGWSSTQVWGGMCEMIPEEGME